MRANFNRRILAWAFCGVQGGGATAGCSTKWSARSSLSKVARQRGMSSARMNIVIAVDQLTIETRTVLLT